MAFATPIIGGLGLISSIFGGIEGAKGGVKSAEAQARANDYQAAVALTNAQIAGQNSKAALARGEVQTENVGRLGHTQLDEITTTQGASGIDLGSESFKAVRAGSAELSRLSELNAQNESQWTAHHFDIEAYQDKLQAEGFRRGAQDIRASEGDIAASSLLGGASQFASKWQQLATSGVF